MVIIYFCFYPWLEALCFWVAYQSIHPSIHSSTSPSFGTNLLNAITPECIKANHSIWVKVLLRYSNKMIRFWVSQVQRSRSPHDQIWRIIQLWSHNSTQMYLVADFVNQRLFAIMLTIIENSRSRGKMLSYHMTKYGEKSVFFISQI